MKHYDVVIVGGGLVGACLALSLRQSSHSVAILEASEPKASVEVHHPLDERAIVLSKASQNILQALDLWSDIEPYATKIQHIHVSQQRHFGAVRLDANHYDIDAMGWVARAQHLYQVLQGALRDVEVLYGAKFHSMQNEGDHAVIDFEQNGLQQITAKLVVAADGSHSAVRAQQNISTHAHDYQQSVILCNVRLQKDHGFCAYERFTQQGPVALLPMAQKTCAVVWAMSPNIAQEIVALPQQDFLRELQTCFGYRLGKIVEVNKPFVFPLSFLRAQQLISDRLVLVGNASQTLHPIAGQGLNLGLRDMATLAELLCECDGDPGVTSLLQAYVSWRQFDQRHIMSLTHSLVTLFSNDFYPLAVGRSLGLVMMERVPKLREVFAQASMGLTGRLPKLVCGVRCDAAV